MNSSCCSSNRNYSMFTVAVVVVVLADAVGIPIISVISCGCVNTDPQSFPLPHALSFDHAPYPRPLQTPTH